MTLEAELSDVFSSGAFIAAVEDAALSQSIALPAGLALDTQATLAGLQAGVQFGFIEVFTPLPTLAPSPAPSPAPTLGPTTQDTATIALSVVLSGTGLAALQASDPALFKAIVLNATKSVVEDLRLAKITGFTAPASGSTITVALDASVSLGAAG